MRYRARLFVLTVCWLAVISAKPANLCASNPGSAQVKTFERKLDTRVERFETAGRTLVASVIDLAYEYELPTAIEYIDHDAATRPINVQFRDDPSVPTSVRHR